MIASEGNLAIPKARPGDPVWGLALLYPAQGEWTEDEYLGLKTGRMIELSDGCLEVLPMATLFHQLIVQALFRLLDDFVRAHGLGIVATAPVPIRLMPGKLREPDVFFAKRDRVPSTRQPPNGADLVIEVLSEGDESRERDLVTKRREFAAAGIPEYWIVDPVSQTIAILTRDAGQSEYVVVGEFGVSSQAASKTLAGFSVDVVSIFASCGE